MKGSKHVKYLASLQIDANHTGSGCLISEEHVLTSAQRVIHIIKNGGLEFAKASVVLGLPNIKSYGTVHDIEKVHHYFQGFKKSNLYFENAYDVGLILVSLLL